MEKFNRLVTNIRKEIDTLKRMEEARRDAGFSSKWHKWQRESLERILGNEYNY